MGRSFVSVEDIHMEDLRAFAEITATQVVETYDDNHLIFKGEPNVIAPLVEVVSSLGIVCNVDSNRKSMKFKLPILT